MNWSISSKSQILFLSSVGVCRAIVECYSYSLSDTLEQVWQLQLDGSLIAYQNIIKSAISGMLLTRGLTAHLYIALYFLILYPILTGKLRSVLLFWMMISGIRSIILNVTLTIMGFLICSANEQLCYPCFQFGAEQAIDLGCSIYTWTVVNDYYHSLKRGTHNTRSHVQSPLSSPDSSSELTDEHSLSVVSADWSLPSSLVALFHKNTQESLNETPALSTSDSKNLNSRSVDSILAQAMVDWFIKKTFKLKRKDDSKSEEEKTSMKGLLSSDVAMLQSKVKNSIRDIDDNEIVDLLISENIDENISSDDTDDKIITKSLPPDDDNPKTPFNMLITDLNTNINSNNNEILEYIIEPDFSIDDIENNIPEHDVTISKDSLNDIQNHKERISELIVEIDNDPEEFSFTNNNYITCELNKIPNKIRDITNMKFNLSPFDAQPRNALRLVKQLFHDNIEDSIQKTIENKLRSHEIGMRIEKNLKILSNNDSLYLNKNMERCNLILTNESNLFKRKNVEMKNKSSGAKTKKKGILKKSFNNYQSDNQIDSNKSKQSIQSNYSNSSINKKLKFRVDSLTTDQENLNKKNFPEYIKKVIDDIESNKFNNDILTNPYNQLIDKQNRFNYKMNSQKLDEKLHKCMTNVKSLRYHYRRINQNNKLPRKKSNDFLLNQKSLMSIINSITNTKSNIPLINQSSFANNKFDDKNSNIFTKESSAQTITTKKLLKKIQELEMS